jgi:hypothetical protein
MRVAPVVSALVLLACSGGVSAIVTDGGTPPPSSDGGTTDTGVTPGEGGSHVDSGIGLGDGSTNLDAGAVRCDQPNPLVASPNAPHGMYLVEFSPTDYNSIYLTTPVVCGANIVINWSQVDHGPTDSGAQYDFSSIDALIQPWKNAGKRVNLLVFGVGFGNAQTVTPAYVLAQVPSTTCNGATPYPEVWTQGYIALYEGAVRAVLTKYGSDDSIGYIRVGLSVGAQADVTCVPELEAKGLTESLFEQYVSTIVAFEASIPHTVQLMLATGPYGAGGPTGDITLPDFEAPLAADAGFGFGNQGLSGADIDAGPGQHCNANWCANFDTFAGKVPLYLQTLVASSPDGGGIGSLVPLLPFAMSHHTQIFEVYAQDFGTAYDPTNPAYAQYGAAYRQLFETTASVLGTMP